MKATFMLQAAICAATFILAVGDLRAQELEPRSYANTPVGMNFAVAGYAYSQGGVVTDPSIPLTNADIRLDGMFLGLARAIDVFGDAGKIDAILPYGIIDGTAEVNGVPAERKVSGFGDPRLRFSYLFHGAPALTLDQLPTYQQDLLFGASMQIGVPVGAYEPEKLVNLSTHRWLFKPEIGMSKAWGPVTLELAAAINLYTDNHDFFGGKTREQDPLYALQSHVIYSFGHGVWAGADATYYTGGKTTVDGVEGNDRQESSRVGVTLALPITKYHSLKLFGSTGLSTRTGSDFDSIGAAFQVRWGGGL